MAYQVKIESSGHTFSVEVDESVLEAALRQGIELPYGCRGGSCGSCRARLIEGSVGYPDDSLPPGLTPEEAAAGDALLCQARPQADLLIGVRELVTPTQIEVKNMPVRVSEMERLCHDVHLLRLKLPATERLQFFAGQYIEILLKDGRRRAFSIANAPHADEYIDLHIRLIEGGEFTHYVFNEMQPKAILRIEGPFGQFYLREDSPRPILMMAGGTGYAPLKGMLEHAFHIGLQRPIHLFWGVRSLRDLYAHDQLVQWSREHANFSYTPVLSEPLASDAWDGETGLVLGSLLEQYPEPAGYDIYMSGPPAMVEAGRKSFLGRGVPQEQMFSDAFEFAADTRDKAAQGGG